MFMHALADIVDLCPWSWVIPGLVLCKSCCLCLRRFREEKAKLTALMVR